MAAMGDLVETLGTKVLQDVYRCQVTLIGDCEITQRHLLLAPMARGFQNLDHLNF